MDLYASIFKRKACRDFTQEPLSDETLEEISQAIEGFQPLYPDVPLRYRFVTQTKGLFRVRAPHYLIVSGEGRDGEKESCGFIFQQLTLWFNAHGIGSVWLGVAKEKKHGRNQRDLMTLAFGKTKGSVDRWIDEFNRKPIGQITNAVDDLCIRAAHLAPSGLNLQPWYWAKEKERVLLYQKKLCFPFSWVYSLSHVDLGIALCHYALACGHINKPFRFKRVDGQDAARKKKGYRLFGELS